MITSRWNVTAYKPRVGSAESETGPAQHDDAGNYHTNSGTPTTLHLLAFPKCLQDATRMLLQRIVSPVSAEGSIAETQASMMQG
jgi:hypothetical protein